jgi:hypothetical protein
VEFNQENNSINSEEDLLVRVVGTNSSADLGGSSKYSNENFED